MTLSARKLMVIGLVGMVLLMANIMVVAHWLDENGIVEGAAHFRDEFLTGSAITIIVVLLILLVNPTGHAQAVTRNCPVCDHTLRGTGQYCSECGSRVGGRG